MVRLAMLVLMPTCGLGLSKGQGEGSNKHPKDFLKAKKPLTFPSVTLLLNPNPNTANAKAHSTNSFVETNA
jgi:hypothetical protein